MVVPPRCLVDCAQDSGLPIWYARASGRRPATYARSRPGEVASSRRGPDAASRGSSCARPEPRLTQAYGEGGVWRTTTGAARGRGTRR